jgi:hypothetical protein
MKRGNKPDAGFEIDQAMAALPAHASLPDRGAVQTALLLLFFRPAFCPADHPQSLQFCLYAVKPRGYSVACELGSADTLVRSWCGAILRLSCRQIREQFT